MRSSKTWVWLVPLLLLTFWLGAHYLDARPIWDDEAYSIKDAGSESDSPADIWHEVANRNPWHPPGYFIVLNGWGRLVSRTPAALRVLSLLCGLLAVAWTYRLGSDMVSSKVGLYGAVMLGTTVMLAYYLDQIRVYTLLTVLGTFTIWLYLRLTTLKKPRPLDWLLLLVGAAGLIYAHYFGVIILAAIGLYHLIFATKTRRWWVITGIFACAGVLFLPWAGVLLEALRMFVNPREFHDRALSNPELVQVLASLFSNGAVVLLVAVLVLALISRLRGGWRVWFFVAATLIPVLVMNGVFHAIPISRIRYLLMLWPLIALAAGMGLVWLGERGTVGRWASLAILLVWAGAGLANVTNLDLIGGLGGANSFFPFQRVVRALSPQASENDLIIDYWPDGSDAPNYNTVNYYGKQLPSKPLLVSLAKGEQHDISPDDIAGRDRIWLAYVPNRAIEAAQSFKTLPTLVSGYRHCGKITNTPDLAIELFARTPVCCGPGEAIARFDDGKITLAGIDGLTATDGQVKPTLGWSLGPDVPIYVYSVTLQVFDSSGNKVAQKDYGLPPRAYACETTSLETASLPPGQYEIRAGVYAWQTQQRLTGVAASGEQGDLVPVGTFRLG